MIPCMRTQGTQTAAQHDGLWDGAEGWPLDVSASVWARKLWKNGGRWVCVCVGGRSIHPCRKSLVYYGMRNGTELCVAMSRFARCPACKGSKPYIELAHAEEKVG